MPPTKPAPAPAAAPNPALPPIAPRTAPAAAPPVVPVSARCCVSDMPAHPLSSDAVRTTTPIVDFILPSCVALPARSARVLLRQEAHEPLGRRLRHLAGIRP